MRYFFNSLIIIIFSLGMVACGQLAPDDNLSLLQHPDVLQKKMAQCQSKETLDCKRIKAVAQEYLSLNVQRQSNPELFGKMILQGEEQLGVLKEKLGVLQRESVNSASVQAELAKVTDAYRAQDDKVKKLLAIVAATSPE